VIPRGNPLLKRADRWVGIPLVWLLGRARRRRRTLPSRLDRIGILKTNAIGDTVLLAGAVADVRAALPDAHLTLFVGSNNLGVARLIEGPHSLVHLPLSRPHRCAAMLRRERLDALLDFGPWPRTNAVLAALAGAGFSAGFRTAGQHRHFAYDQVVDHSPEIHEIENYRRLVSVLGIPAGLPPRLARGGDPPEDLLSAPFAVLHPWPGGTRRELKQWPDDRWSSLAARLQQEGLHLVFTGGPADSEHTAALVAGCRRAGCADVVSAAGRLDVGQLATLVSQAAVVVSVDTGVMHIASALDAPLVALHGPTAPWRWGPLSPHAVPVASSTPGCGYLYLGFDYPASPPPCMESITVEAVHAAVHEAIAAAAGSD